MQDTIPSTPEPKELSDSHSWPTFCNFLKKLCDDANLLAQSDGIGTVSSRVIQAHDKLHYVEVQFTDKEVEDHQPRFRLFAAGKYDVGNRRFSMVKIEKQEEPYNYKPQVFSNDEETLLRYISF